MSHSGPALWLDIQTTQNPPPHSWRGIPRYVAGQSAALWKKDGAVRRFALNPLLPFPEKIDGRLVRSGALTWSTGAEFRRAAAEGPTAYYIMSPFERLPLAGSLLPPFALDSGIPLIVTLYDLIPLLRPLHYLPDESATSHYHARLELIRSADLVLAISRHTRQDGINLLGLDPEKVHVIGAGVSPFFRPSEPGEDPGALIRSSLPAIRRPFILSVLGAEERKNTERMIEAYGLLDKDLRAQIQLVIACQLNEEYKAKWNQIARQSGLAEDELVLTDLISDDVLRALYQSTDLFVFPSLYEGFGLPAAEAAACGAPVMTSNSSSLPEVLDYPPATFDPADPTDIAAAMNRGISDLKFSQALRVMGRSRAPIHTWDEVAQRTVDSLKSLPQHNNPGVTAALRTPLRIALVTSLDHTRSRFAGYCLRMAGALCNSVSVDVFAPFGHDGMPPGDRPFRLFQAESLLRSVNPAAYDAIIYSLDTGPDDRLVYDIAVTHPGICWLHELRIREAGDGLLRPLIDASRAVVVDCGAAYSAVMLHGRLKRNFGPVISLPLAPRSVPQSAAPSIQEPPRLAVVSPLDEESAKTVVEAIRALVRLGPIQTVFLGPMPEKASTAVREHAGKTGLEDHIPPEAVTSDIEYGAALMEASAALEIQAADRIAGSPALADCLAAGVPVLTNLLSCADLPDGTVAMLEEEPTPRRIAAQIERMLNNQTARASLRQAGRAYAASVTAESVADSLVQLAGRLDEAPPQRRHFKR